MNKFTKALAAIMLMMVFAVSCTKPDDSINSMDVSGNNYGHDYVDLGLPSGTLWATCNVGADAPEGYGDYYAWGEHYRKIDFGWETYKFSAGGSNSMKKYCLDPNFGYNGFTDSLIVLEPEDDVATSWLGNWCMPTKEQWEVLDQNTIQSITTLNGVEGMLFTASNGNRLFLPASALYGSNSHYYGSYWSKTLANKSSDAWLYYFHHAGDHFVNEFERCQGFPIRPVFLAE